MAPSYSEYLDSIDLPVIRERIRLFRSSCEELNERELRESLWGIFAPSGHGVLPVEILNRGFEGTYWRARVTGENDVQRAILTRQDLWAPPPEKVNLGRLNAANAPLLYTALDDPYTAALEARPKPGDHVALVRYRPMQPIRLTSFKPSIDLQSLSPMQLQKHNNLSGFIEQEVFNPSDDHRRYRITALITTDMFDYPPQLTEGWIYASIRRPGGTNVALRVRQARRVLKPFQVHACTWNEALTCHAISDLRGQTGSGFRWREPTQDDLTY